ncbi:hypothetical protein M378DRAFT_17566 [Amanita muscaria Koide BX008]|uniref:Uncharacterized protein n=1 Tax=Amanita muscaria (strain Koide BX008) TaxID=946122 RepID=A0A0C2W415_AMAMK|nr:hypothetical protein M378DRAFT_17566 [Amanita muscaria Koide BX008]
MSDAKENPVALKLRMLNSIGQLYRSVCSAGKQEIFLERLLCRWVAFFPPREAPELQVLGNLSSRWTDVHELKHERKFIEDELSWIKLWSKSDRTPVENVDDFSPDDFEMAIFGAFMAVYTAAYTNGMGADATLPRRKASLRKIHIIPEHWGSYTRTTSKTVSAPATNTSRRTAAKPKATRKISTSVGPGAIRIRKRRAASSDPHVNCEAM